MYVAVLALVLMGQAPETHDLFGLSARFDKVDATLVRVEDRLAAIETKLDEFESADEPTASRLARTLAEAPPLPPAPGSAARASPPRVYAYAPRTQVYGDSDGDGYLDDYGESCAVAAPMTYAYTVQPRRGVFGRIFGGGGCN